MKKTNALLGILYVNTLILIVVGIYFIKPAIELVSFMIFNTEPNLDDMSEIQNMYKIIGPIFNVWIIAYLVFSIINIIAAIKDYRNSNFELLYKKTKRIKFGLIPFWIINFLCYFIISCVIIPVGHGFGFLIVPLFIFCSYTVLVVTSIFSIMYILKLKMDKILTKKESIIHIILQLCFVLDIIDMIYLIKKWSKPNFA